MTACALSREHGRFGDDRENGLRAAGACSDRGGGEQRTRSRSGRGIGARGRARRNLFAGGEEYRRDCHRDSSIDQAAGILAGVGRKARGSDRSIRRRCGKRVRTRRYLRHKFRWPAVQFVCRHQGGGLARCGRSASDEHGFLCARDSAPHEEKQLGQIHHHHVIRGKATGGWPAAL